MIRYITSTLVCVVVVHSWIALQAHPVPLFQQGHSDLCQSVAGFIKHAHKNCVIGTEVEVVRDATQGPSVVITEPGVAHTVHVPDSGEPLKLRVDIKFSEVPGSMPHYLG